MSRTDADSWDVASSVGATATMVAAARAVASRQPDPLINDPFAVALVRAVGVDFFTRFAEGELNLSDVDKGGTAELMTTVMAVRTKFFDDFFIGATAVATLDDGATAVATSDIGATAVATSDGVAGSKSIRQAVILASGLDSRPYRLPWPDGTVVYEIDQPKVVEFKTETMKAIGAAPTAERRAVAIDLREDWPAALRRSGFDDSRPTAWSAEGLLVYLPPDAQDRLFDDITALSAPGSQLATEYHPDAGASIGQRAAALSDEWQEHGFDVNLADLFYPGERSHVVDYLTGHGWQVCARSRPEMFREYGKEFPDNDELGPMRDSLAVIAKRK
jgi:methyltransferase (TIGR00027 family)